MKVIQAQGMQLTGKVAVITGASMGIGEAIARVFAQQGASVALCSRDLARAEAARLRIGNPERTLAVAADVTRRTDIASLSKTALNHFGRIDIWVNNAGHGLGDSVAAMDIAACRRMFDTNLFGAVEAMQVVIPIMKEQGGGCIINISSVAGHIAVPYMAAYCATKHALNAMGKAARMELRGSGIDVLTVCPGYVRTEFAANAVKGKDRRPLGEKLRRGITADRVARAVLRGYQFHEREVIVPWTNRIAIKFYQLIPSVVEWGIERTARNPAVAGIRE